MVSRTCTAFSKTRLLLLLYGNQSFAPGVSTWYCGALGQASFLLLTHAKRKNEATMTMYFKVKDLSNGLMSQI